VSDWYRGDCHVHSTHSGWQLTPARLVADARAMGLDFLAATEHRDAGGYDEWMGQDDLLVIPGREAPTGTGHWLALGLPPGHIVDWRYGVRDGAVDGHLAEVHRLGGLCVAAHPHAPYPSGQFMYPYDGFDVVEVWNGPWTSDRPWQADNEAALAEWGRALGAGVHSGRWRPAMGNSDTHYEGQLGIPHTVVRAESLTPGALLAGIRAGHSWIAASTDVSLSLTATAGARSAGIGDRLPVPPDTPVLVRVEVTGVPAGTVSLRAERGLVHQEPLAGSGIVEWPTTPAGSGFVRVEVRRDGGAMAALSNPVLLS
jgi:hypothetical protein